MEHEHNLEWISADLDGELSPAQHQKLHTHLQSCPSCAQLYRELAEQSEALRSLDCTPPPSLRRNILEHLPPQEPVRRRIPLWKGLTALAACLAVVVTAGYLSRSHTTPPVSSRTLPATSAYSVETEAVEVPGGDDVLLLSAPLPADCLALLEQCPTSLLETGYQCCIADAATTAALKALMDQHGLLYTHSPAATPDGSGNTAILWPNP